MESITVNNPISSYQPHPQGHPKLLAKLHKRLILLIMSTRTNLAAHRKLSNTIELKSRYSTVDDPRLSETVKLPALNAISKSVKYNDLSFATSRDLHKLRKEPEVAEDYTEVAAHNILLAIRRKYDNMSKARELKERQIEDLETERQKFQIERDQYAEEKGSAEKKVRRFEEELQRVRVLGEEGEMEKRIMLAMTARIKYDKVVYDQRRFDLEQDHRQMRRTQQVIERENANHQEEGDRTRKVYSKLVEHFEAQQTERELHMASLQRMLEEKNGLVEYTTVREVEMREIAENTLQDKDHKEKNWYKVYLCHRFVEKLLRDKMTREMLKFSTVEVAYKNIKMETGVSDVASLISKFLNKEHIYGDLLGKIADNEKHISDLKTENEQLTRERTKLKAEKSDLYSNKKDHRDLTQEEKDYLAVSDKAMHCNLLYERVRIWLQRNQRKFLRMDGKLKDRHAEEDSSETVAAFKEYVALVEKALSEARDVPEREEIVLGETVRNKLNLRVRVGEEKNEATRESNEAKEHDEDEFVTRQREELHHTNEKFMRELKRKYEDIKKTRAEGEPRRKDSPEKAQGTT